MGKRLSVCLCTCVGMSLPCGQACSPVWAWVFLSTCRHGCKRAPLQKCSHVMKSIHMFAGVCTCHPPARSLHLYHGTCVSLAHIALGLITPASFLSPLPKEGMPCYCPGRGDSGVQRLTWKSEILPRPRHTDGLSHGAPGRFTAGKQHKKFLSCVENNYYPDRDPRASSE